MNNLYRELAPISPSAWAEIEEEASRTLKKYLGGRQIVDVHEPQGFDLSAVGKGHTQRISPVVDGVRTLKRQVNPVIELRIPFKLTRDAINDVARGSSDSDWQPLKDAAQKLSFAEDSLIFNGYEDGGIDGILPETSNEIITLPESASDYPNAVAQALTQLRQAGVNGPYALVLGTEAYTKASGSADDGYPVLRRLEQLVEVPIIWSQSLKGGLVVSTRGGDFDLWLGQDISIGYLQHDAESVELYLQETLTFQMQTAEAVVVLKHGE